MPLAPFCEVSGDGSVLVGRTPLLVRLPCLQDFPSRSGDLSLVLFLKTQEWESSAVPGL